MIPAEYILMKKLGKHYLIDSYEHNLQKDNKIKKMSVFDWQKEGRTHSNFKNMCRVFAGKHYYFA